MKKVLMVLLVLLFTVSMAAAAELKVGDKVAPFSVKDGAGKVYTLASPLFAGKVVAVIYTDKFSADKNEAIDDTLKAFDLKTYAAMPVANLKDTPLPDFLIKKVVKMKQEKIKSPIFIDDSHMLVNAWGLRPKAYNIVVIDKGGVVRFIYKAPERAAVPKAEVDKFVSIVKEYQAK